MEGNDVQHGHITCACDKDGVIEMHSLWQNQSEGIFRNGSVEKSARRVLLSHATVEETWYNE